MKTQSLSTIVALAGVAAATNGWGSGSQFSCPSNTNNTCNPQQSTGFDWGSLPTGDFGSYGDFSFSGFKCVNAFGKRSGLDLNKRTGKCITGVASGNKGSSPSFSCGSSKSVKDFSVTHMEVDVEFDCTLEFHYDMPGGSTCKQTSPCKSGGSTVKNSQCGGATGVTVVYPSQPSKPKPSCSIAINTIGFDCSSASTTVVHSSTKPVSSNTKPTSAATTSVSNTKPASSETKATSSASSTYSKPETASKPETSPTKPASSETKPASSETKPASTSNKPATSPPVYTSINGTTKSFETSPSATSGSSATSAVTSPASSPSVFTTSTIFTTQVSTIISCAPTVTNCPAHSTALTTMTIAISTTVCPVTESSKPTSAPTLPISSGPGSSAPSSSAPGSSAPGSSAPGSSAPSSSGPASSQATSGVSVSTPPAANSITTVIVSQSTTICPFTSTHTTGGVTSLETGLTTSTIAVTITSTVCTKCEASATSVNSGSASTTAQGPAPTAPAPELLPKCMNTWNFIVGCIDNTDHACYCPSTDFVNNVYGCLSAYGADANEIATAQSFFQGICAPYIPSNPAVVTGASSIQATAGVTQPASIPVTTVQVLTTLVVPCSQTAGPSAGSIIPSSFSTTTLSTAITVPQVVFSTAPPASANAGATTAAPAGPQLVVGTPPAVPAATTAPAASGGITAPSAGKTTIATVPLSNGTAKATATPAQFTAGASNNAVALGSGLFAMMFAVLAL